MLLDPSQSSLLIVDIQEGLAPVMADPRSVYRGAAILMHAAHRLNIPTVVSEQYPKGLGPTVGELRSLVPPEAVIEKIHFSCAREPAITQALSRPQVLIAGIEAHVCVLQSAIGLKDMGKEVFVVTDACSSRQLASHQAAMARMAAAGVQVLTVEMALFEWLQRGSTPEFKELLPLIR